MMLLLAGTASVTGQEARMVVTGNMVNTGTIVSEVAIDLRQNSDGTGVITNTGVIKTPALTVDTGTTLNNEASGDICVGCEAGAPAWPAALLLTDAAKNYSGDADENPAEGWTGATNGDLSGTTSYSSWQTGGTAPATKKNLMVSQYVYAGTADNPVSVQSTTAGSNNYTAAVSLSSLSAGITWENAVKLCATSTEGGYTDWYLPNSMEIDALYNAKLLGWSNISSRASVSYWSSTEYSATIVWTRTFNSSSAVTLLDLKTNDSVTNYTWVARCVRRTN